MAYCTKDEVRQSAQSMTASAVPPADDAFVETLIERASRLFDNEVGVTDSYFEEAGVSASNLTVYGNGGNFLRLPPYVAGSLASLTYPDGYEALPYVERDGYLMRTDSNGVLLSEVNSPWYSGTPIILSARWGFAATPADVKQEIIEWVINIWRETDPAGLKLVNLDGVPLREDIPPRVREVIRMWRVKTNPVFM